MLVLQGNVSSGGNKWYRLTTSRVRLGKSIARSSYKATAQECFNSEGIRRQILVRLGQLFRQEMKMCSCAVNSVLLRSISVEGEDDVWRSLLSELNAHAPVLSSLLLEFVRPAKGKNRSHVMCVITAILLNCRWSRMSGIHQIISLILYSGHASKMVSYYTSCQCCIMDLFVHISRIGVQSASSSRIVS